MIKSLLWSFLKDRAGKETECVLDNDEFTFDKLQKMWYCNRIIKETERKYPIAGIATRVATKNCEVPNSDTTIPCGMKTFIQIYAIHHDEKYLDSEKFDPQRFTEESKKQPIKFLPFGAGPRQCISYRFTETLIGIGLISLLRSFEFATCEQTQVPLEFKANKNTLHPKCGVTCLRILIISFYKACIFSLFP